MITDSKENTLRILKGQDPIQKLRCRLNWHRWTAWELQNNKDTLGYHREWVKCHCADCGLLRVELPFSKTIRESSR
jgi:hypothetical protein